MLAGEYAVRPGNRLHERVVPHRLVEVDGRATRRVKPGEPHRAHENQPQRIVGILKFLVQFLVIHPLPVRLDVESEHFHLRDLVLCRGHDDRHVSRNQDVQPGLEFGQFRKLFVRSLPLDGVQASDFLYDPFALSYPILPHLVVHFEGRGFVDGNHHRLANKSSPEKMPHDVLGHGVQPVVACEDMVLPPQLPFQLGLLLGIEFRLFDEIVDVFVEIRVHQLQLGGAVLVKERDRRSILDRLLEIVDGDVIAENILRPLLPGNQRGAGKSDEQRAGNRRPHVHGQRVVLAPVRFVGHRDHVGSVAEHLR